MYMNFNLHYLYWLCKFAYNVISPNWFCFVMQQICNKNAVSKMVNTFTILHVLSKDSYAFFKCTQYFNDLNSGLS